MLLRIHFDAEAIRAAGFPVPDFDSMVQVVGDDAGGAAIDIPMFGRISKLSLIELDRVKPEALRCEAEITLTAILDFLRTGSPAMAASIVSSKIATAPKDSVFPIIIDVENFSERLDGKWARLADLVAA